MMMLKFKILWGEEPDTDSKPDVYEFKTEAEAKAFWRGVQDAEGWNGMTLYEDDEIVAEGKIDEIAYYQGTGKRMEWR
jgi:hypothetical protein